MPGKFGANPHPALLPVLLMMTQGRGDVEKTLDELVSFIQSTKAALESMRSGIQTFQAGMLKMAPPPGRPGTPASWFGPVKGNNGEPGQAP